MATIPTMVTAPKSVSVDGAADEKVTVSVVSHGQSHLIKTLIADLARYCGPTIEVTLTLNLPEVLPFDPTSLPFKMRVIHNLQPKGFGENHNAAFVSGCSNFFCVINPDIRLHDNPFPILIQTLDNPRVGVVAPLILDSEKNIADSARKFPTIVSILRKLFRKKVPPDYVVANQLVFPDWVAGMFMLFRHEVFRELSGFDRKYFLYYEDVDLCARLRIAGYHAALCPWVEAIHDAQRASHRDFRYLKWHLSSMARFFVLSVRQKISARQWQKQPIKRK